MVGGKGPAILKIARHGADHNFRAAVKANVNNIVQIALEAAIDGGHARVVLADMVFQKHDHPAPFALIERSVLKMANQVA
jgi:hypothetical protein